MHETQMKLRVVLLPFLKLSKMIRTLVLLLVALAFASLALADFCGPAYSVTQKECKHKIEVCAAQNATLKFTGRGCRTFIRFELQSE